jgi:hypothetical protein
MTPQGATQATLAQARTEVVGPHDLALGDPVQDRPAARREPDELGAAVGRVLQVGDDALHLEAIGGALHALAGQAHGPRDLRDGAGLVIDGAEDLPPGTGLTGGRII